MIYSKQLGSRFIAWRALGPGELALDLPELACCDMTGAVDIATKLDPDVWRIEVFSGGDPDVRYLKIESGWVSVDTRKPGGRQPA